MYCCFFQDTKIHHAESGDSSKPLMIFLHGFPEFWYSWRHQIVEFQKDYWYDNKCFYYFNLKNIVQQVNAMNVDSCTSSLLLLLPNSTYVILLSIVITINPNTK